MEKTMSNKLKNISLIVVIGSFLCLSALAVFKNNPDDKSKSLRTAENRRYTQTESRSPKTVNICITRL